MKRPVRPWPAALALFGCLACGGEDGRGVGDASQTRDSLGVTIVESTAPALGVEPWTVSDSTSMIFCSGSRRLPNELDALP